jgi:hypothetical protein
MSVTYGVSGSSPFADFSQDLENILIQYIYDRWGIADPAKPPLKQGFGQDIEFRPGFDRGTPTYQVLCIQTDTETLEADTSQRSFKFLTRFEITIITNRMGDLDNVQPQLGYMEREVQRIINQYRYLDIPGIVNLVFRGQTRVYDDIIAGANSSPTIRGSSIKSQTTETSSWPTTRWKTRLFVEAEYYKDDISTP